MTTMMTMMMTMTMTTMMMMMMTMTMTMMMMTTMMMMMTMTMLSHSENHPRSKWKEAGGVPFSWSFRDKGSSPPLCCAK